MVVCPTPAPSLPPRPPQPPLGPPLGRHISLSPCPAEKIKETLGERNIKPGFNAGGNGTGGLAIREVDVCSADKLSAEAFKGVSQVVVATGAVFGRLDDGVMGYINNLTPERVDAMGNENVAKVRMDVPETTRARIASPDGWLAPAAWSTTEL